MSFLISGLNCLRTPSTDVPCSQGGSPQCQKVKKIALLALGAAVGFISAAIISFTAVPLIVGSLSGALIVIALLGLAKLIQPKNSGTVVSTPTVENSSQPKDISRPAALPESPKVVEDGSSQPEDISRPAAPPESPNVVEEGASQTTNLPQTFEVEVSSSSTVSHPSLPVEVPSQPVVPLSPATSSALPIQLPKPIETRQLKDFDPYSKDADMPEFQKYYFSLEEEPSEKIDFDQYPFFKQVNELTIEEFRQASGAYLTRHLKDIPPFCFALLTDAQIKAIELRDCSEHQISYLLYIDCAVCQFDHVREDGWGEETDKYERILGKIGLDKFATLTTPRLGLGELEHCKRLIRSLPGDVRYHAIRVDVDSLKEPTPPPVILSTPQPTKPSCASWQVGETKEMSSGEIVKLELRVTMGMRSVKDLPGPLSNFSSTPATKCISTREDLKGMEFVYVYIGDKFIIRRIK